MKLLEQVEQFGNIRPPSSARSISTTFWTAPRKSACVGFAAHMTIEEDYDPSLPSTYVDGDQMLQVFLNLLEERGRSRRHERRHDQVAHLLRPVAAPAPQGRLGQPLPLAGRDHR